MDEEPFAPNNPRGYNGTLVCSFPTIATIVFVLDICNQRNMITSRVNQPFGQAFYRAKVI